MTLNLDSLQLLARTTSMLSIDAVQKANSGHPGLPMGASSYASLLFAKYLRFNPKDPEWINRDRFVLSAGHGSMLLYSLLHLFGYDLSLDEIKEFRQWKSKTPGHPEFGFAPGVEATTGPLGQGFGNGVGMALSAKLLASQYSEEIFNYRVFGLVSDGDVMEGISSEAASLAGHLGLGNLIYLYDDNRICLAGKTDTCFTESVPKRFEAFEWHVQTVDAYDLEAVSHAIEAAIQEKDRPSLICVRSVIGYGSPKKADSFEAHGSPLGADEVKATKKNLGWSEDAQFYVPKEVTSFCAELLEEKRRYYTEWNEQFSKWMKATPEKYALLEKQMTKALPEELKNELMGGLGHSKKEATRSLSGKAIQLIAKHLPGFIGGSADLEPSTKTLIKDSQEIQKGAFKGRNIRFGVREHAMGAAVNGLAYSKLWFPYSATFLVFSDYMRPSIRLAALSHIQSLFIFTHDSFWVGEDGPTHEPIEHIQALRLIPNLYVFRPADGIEVGVTYFHALSLKDRPSALLFTRQDVEPLQRDASCSPEQILKGGYVVRRSKNEQIVIVATGSEVALALQAADTLETQGVGVRVVSMPCVEIFVEQDPSYQAEVLPPSLKKVSLEAGSTIGWERIVGSDGLLLGIDHYGASAPGEVLAEQFGFTAPTVARKITSWLKK